MSMVGAAAAEALGRLGALLPVDPEGLSDRQLVGLAQVLAEVHRQVDALDLAVAGEVGRRSQAGSGESLARRLGFATAAGAIQSLTGSSAREAVRLVKDVTNLSRLPEVEEAALAGRIGRQSAAAIAGELAKAAGDLTGADAAQLSSAAEQLVELAATADADEVRARAAETAAALSTRAVQDRAAKAMAERFFWIGPVVDGSARVSGLLPAGHAAVVVGLFDAFVNPKGAKTVTFQPESEQVPADGRTAGQKRADLLRDICAAQARAADTPDMGGDHPTVWVATTLAELEAGTGAAFYAGASEPVPATEAVQAACTGGIQPVVFDEQGAVLALGRAVRGFTKRQRRAIALRDGGTCLIPGCTTPAQWCEAHHVTAYKDGGATDVANGVLLCWHHHHDIDTGPWRIRMKDGTPQVRYSHAGKTLGWRDAGDGTAARLRAQAPPGG